MIAEPRDRRQRRAPAAGDDSTREAKGDGEAKRAEEDEERSEDGEDEHGGRLTERGRAREREDDAFEQVIVKRVDTARRHPDDILEHTIATGAEQLDRAPRSLALSSVAGGFMLTFSVMAVAVVAEASGTLPEEMRRVAMALAYPLGFIVCIMSGMELFTEHTATAVYPVLDGRADWRKLARLWVIVLAGNLLGSAVGAGMLALGEGVVKGRAAYLQIALATVAPPGWTMFASAVLAGALMALGSWLVHATSPGSSQLLVIYLVVFLIGLGSLHHSIAGSSELFVAKLLGSELSTGEVVKTIAISVAGNLLGGSLLVAIVNYGHIRSSQSVGKRPPGKKSASAIA